MPDRKARAAGPGNAARRLLGERARALSDRGWELIEQGRYHDAEKTLIRALAMTERAFGRDALAVSTPLNNLGVVYKYLARFQEAGPLYQRALAIIERRLGRGHPRAATLYHNLGGLEHSAGNWARGEPFARESVRIRRRAVGPWHPALAADMAALAALLDRQEKYDEAEQLYVRAMAIFERAYGPDDPEVAVSLNNLAAVHQARGRPRQAEAMYRRALAIDTAHLGPDHPKVAFCANNLSVLLKSRGRLEEAGACAREAIRIFTRTLGRDHLNVGICLENYADVLRRQRRRTEAGACARRAARILGKVEAVNDDGVALTGTINPLFASYRLMVKPSPIHRMGVFADEPIPAGRKVIEYTGERISRREAARRSATSRNYLFALDSYWTLDGAIGGSGAEYVNHSCEPNLRARRDSGRIVYVSRRRIAKGEELTLDYRYNPNQPPIPCACGAPGCRGTMNLPPGARTSRA